MGSARRPDQIIHLFIPKHTPGSPICCRRRPQPLYINGFGRRPADNIKFLPPEMSFLVWRLFQNQSGRPSARISAPAGAVFSGTPVSLFQNKNRRPSARILLPPRAFFFWSPLDVIWKIGRAIKLLRKCYNLLRVCNSPLYFSTLKYWSEKIYLHRFRLKIVRRS